MIFGFLFKWTLRLAIPVVIAGGLLVYFGWGLQDASLEEFKLTGISNINTEAFTLNGALFVKNPSDISVPVKSVDYVVILKETGEVIGKGNVGEFTLLKKDITEILFDQEVRWVPTTQLAIDLITKDEVYVEIKGNLTLDIPKADEHLIPFEAEQDIKVFIEQFIPVDIPDLGLGDELPLIPENKDNDSKTPLGVLG